jgi:hypothetical protein
MVNQYMNGISFFEVRNNFYNLKILKKASSLRNLILMIKITINPNQTIKFITENFPAIHINPSKITTVYIGCLTYLYGPDFINTAFLTGTGKTEKFLFNNNADHNPIKHKRISAINKNIFSGSTCPLTIKKITQANCKITIV